MKPWLPKPKSVPRKTSRITFDEETFLINPGIQAPPISVLGFKIAGDRKVHKIMARDPAFDRVLRAMLEDRGVLMVAHHARFDMACLLAHEPDWAEIIFQKFNDDGVTCTLIRETLIWIAKANPMEFRRKFDLGTCYEKIGGTLPVNKLDPYRMTWGKLADLSIAQIRAQHPGALEYLETDVLACDELWQYQETKHATWLLDQYRQTRASFALYLAQCWGVTTDGAAVDELHRATKKALDEASAICFEHELVREDGTRNVAKAAEYQERAYAKLGLLAPRNDVTEKAKIKAGESALKQALMKGMSEDEAEAIADEARKCLLGNVVLDEEACNNAQDPIMDAYCKTSQAGLLLGKVTRLRRSLIQASYNTVVNTGRTSCRQGKDPKRGEAPTSHGSQMQNPPRQEGIRECFVARPGYVMVSIDYDAFELRTWGQCCLWMVGYSKLAEILNDPKRDPHVEMGATIHKMSTVDAYALKSTDKKKFKELRQIAKAANFGLPGGMGAERFVSSAWDSYQVSVTVDEAKEVIAAWKKMYPEAKKYLELIGKLSGERGARTRAIQHYSARVRGGLGYCDLANTFFQGLAADAAKEAMWRVCCEMYARKSSALYGSRIIAFVHDELICEIPIPQLQEASKRLQELWCAGAQDCIPDVLITAAPAASFRWSKAFGDPVYLDGKLIPFETQDGFSGRAPRPEQLEAWERLR